MDYKKKFFKYKKKYEQLRSDKLQNHEYINLKGGMLSPLRRDSINFAFNKVEVSKFNDFFEKNFNKLYFILQKICFEIQSHVNLKRIDSLKINNWNKEQGLISEKTNMGYIILLGGSALNLLSKKFSKYSNKELELFSQNAPRTSDFDISICLNDYNKSSIDSVKDLILLFLESNAEIKEILVELEQFDISLDNKNKNEEILNYILGNKIQITTINLPTNYNIRVNILINSKRNHLFEFILRKTDEFSCNFKNVITIDNIIGIPNIYQKTINYARIIFRRSRKKISKCRQDYARFEWLIKFSKWLLQSKKPQDIISLEQFFEIKKIYKILKNELKFCINEGEKSDLEKERDEYFKEEKLEINYYIVNILKKAGVYNINDDKYFPFKEPKRLIVPYSKTEEQPIRVSDSYYEIEDQPFFGNFLKNESNNCSKRNKYEITKEEENIILNFDKKRILMPYDKNPLKKEYYIKKNNIYIPKRTLNVSLNDIKYCSYCERLSKEFVTPNITPSYITGFGGDNCPSILKEQIDNGIKCTLGNAYTLVIPSYHISIPMTKDWLDIRKRDEAGDINYIFGGMSQEVLKIISKIMYNMYLTTMDWGNDMLAYKKYNGTLNKFYKPKLCNTDYSGKYYDKNLVNRKASEGGAEIGTIFAFFHYPTGEHHALGRLWEHLHLQVPIRCTDDGYSHQNFKKYENTKKWESGLKFMENNITGETRNVAGNNSGKTFKYTYNKLNSFIKEHDISRALDYDAENLIIDFNENIYDIKNIKFNRSFLDNLDLIFDHEKNLYVYELPKGSLLYRGFHSTTDSVLNCGMLKTLSDSGNTFSTKYTWYSNLNTALSYAVIINIKEYKKRIPNFDILNKTNKDELYKQILSLDKQLGIIKVYKTTKSLKFVDLVNSKNLEILIKEYDRLNIIKKNNGNRKYMNYKTYPQNVIRNDRISNENKSNDDSKEIERLRLDLMYTTGIAVNIHEQIINIKTTASKKLGIKRYFSLIEGNTRLDTDKLLYTRYKLKNKTVISHLLKDCNRFSGIDNDLNMVKLLDELFRKNYTEGDIYGLNKYKDLHGYIGISTPSLGTKAGYFNPELCIFSNIDDEETVLIDDFLEDTNNSCHPNSRINKIINSLAVYLYTYKFQLNCKWEDVNLDDIDDDDILEECKNIIQKIETDSDEIKSYNKNVSRCPSLILRKDNF